MPDHGELLRAIPAPEAPDERKPEPVHVLAAGVGPAIARLTAELVEAQKTARKSTTLRDAAEALLKVATGCWLEEPDDTGAMRDALTALRAALAAEDAWRARAEAAIAVMEAKKRSFDVWSNRDVNLQADMRQLYRARWKADRAYAAARRRYEETCRG